MSNLIQVVSLISAVIALVHQVKASKQFSSGETSRAYRSGIVSGIGWASAYFLLTISKMAM